MSKGAPQDSTMSLECKARFYKVLADCYHLPDPSLWEALGSLLGFLTNKQSRFASHIQSMLAAADGEAGLQALTVDFSKLFVGPFSLLAPPYGSVYLENEKRVMGESTASAGEYYAREGLAMADRFQEAPDHIAAELEFLHFLYAKELAAMAEGDRTTSRRYFAQRQEFLREHLGQWVSPFAAAVKQEAGTSFYKHLASLTEMFLAEDMRSSSDSA